jgi:hypothetical protein
MFRRPSSRDMQAASRPKVPDKSRPVDSKQNSDARRAQDNFMDENEQARQRAKLRPVSSDQAKGAKPRSPVLSEKNSLTDSDSPPSKEATAWRENLMGGTDYLSDDDAGEESENKKPIAVYVRKLELLVS